MRLEAQFQAGILLYELEYLAQEQPELCLDVMKGIHFMVDDVYRGGDSFRSLYDLVYKDKVVSAEEQAESRCDPDEERVMCPHCDEYAIPKRCALAQKRSLLIGTDKKLS